MVSRASFSLSFHPSVARNQRLTFLNLRSFIEPYLDVLRASNEFGSIWRGLDLPPSLMVHILGGGGLGLGRRMSIVSSREAQVADSVSFYCE